MTRHSGAVSPGGAAPQKLPTTITIAGTRYTLTRHAREYGDLRNITAAEIRQVIVNWTARGVCADSTGNRTRTYWGFPPGKTRIMVKVVISLESDEIITLQHDGDAARRLAQNGRPWFQQRCRNLEVRGES